MIQLITEGIGYGLFLAILVGPIFMSLVDTSIQFGKRSGLVLASGIWASDFIIVTVLFLFADQRQNHFSETWAKGLAVVATLLFLGIGIGKLIRWKKTEAKDASYNPRKSNLFLKGVAVNTINPFTLIFWTTLMAGQTMIRQAEWHSLVLFFGVLLATVVSTDALKVILADKLGNILHSKHLRVLNLITGFIFIGSGLYIAIKFFYLS
ncbi:MAG: LysE family transporter [Saprospiraceae bacterium]|nr:LysE family transporter [Saprospiraceae bacterium]MBK7788984.1 LysE family transporter [Saprospiraceae bacterium]MBK8108907.1 LysE family transporter [Saprospiraceae bacterium]MBK8849809.1 LysE family transporter [Saprospiraceae bacterium]MBK9687050.1 LysE family transporter [Saprospiraceae bacterium]